MLDGGYVRALCKQSNKPPKDPQYIEKIAHACRTPDEVIHRIMFYDSGGFSGTAKQPVSGQTKQFTANDRWLHELSYKDLFSIRLGVLKFRGRNVEPYIRILVRKSLNRNCNVAAAENTIRMARRGCDRRGFPAVQNGGGRTDARFAI